MSQKTAKQVTPEMLAELRALLDQKKVEAMLTVGGEEGLNERTLSRWLRARKFDVARAAKDLTEHAKWRAEYVPKGILAEEEVQPALDQDKSFLASGTGCDKEGHPTLIARVRNHKVAKDSQDFYHFMVYALDTGILCGLLEEQRSGRAWDGKVVGILDLQNITLSNCDSSGLMIIFDVLQNHYVERLHKMYLYCSPSIFYGVWAVVSPFVDPVTRKKVQFVSAKDASAIFAQDYEPGVLPVELGGTGPEQPLYLARRELLKEQEALKQATTPVQATAPEQMAVPA